MFGLKDSAINITDFGASNRSSVAQKIQSFLQKTTVNKALEIDEDFNIVVYLVLVTQLDGDAQQIQNSIVTQINHDNKIY